MHWIIVWQIILTSSVIMIAVYFTVNYILTSTPFTINLKKKWGTPLFGAKNCDVSKSWKYFRKNTSTSDLEAQWCNTKTLYFIVKKKKKLYTIRWFTKLKHFHSKIITIVIIVIINSDVILFKMFSIKNNLDLVKSNICDGEKTPACHSSLLKKQQNNGQKRQRESVFISCPT